MNIKLIPGVWLLTIAVFSLEFCPRIYGAEITEKKNEKAEATNEQSESEYFRRFMSFKAVSDYEIYSEVFRPSGVDYATSRKLSNYRFYCFIQNVRKHPDWSVADLRQQSELDLLELRGYDPTIFQIVYLAADAQSDRVYDYIRQKQMSWENYKELYDEAWNNLMACFRKRQNVPPSKRDSVDLTELCPEISFEHP